MAKKEIKRPTSTAQAKSILLVEDDPDVRTALEQALCCQHYHVVPAANGRQALVELAATQIDVVLLDLNLGPENGWSIFQEIIALQPLLPIVVMTGRPELFCHRELPRARAFMEKPLDLPVLFRLLEDLACGNSQLAPEI